MEVVDLQHGPRRSSSQGPCRQGINRVVAQTPEDLVIQPFNAPLRECRLVWASLFGLGIDLVEPFVVRRAGPSAATTCNLRDHDLTISKGLAAGSETTQAGGPIDAM